MSTPTAKSASATTQWSRSLILAYHEVCTSESLYAYSIDCNMFREHISLARSAATDLARNIQITFDDGHVSVFQHALPILEEARVKATLFVTVGLIGRHRLSMSWPQLRELCALGHNVQSHTWSHVFLNRCSDATLREELGSSKNELENHLGVSVDSIAAPGGRWNQRALNQCAKAGYARLFISQPWVHRPEAPVSVFGRVMVRRTMDVPYLRRLAVRDPMLLLSMRAKATVSTTLRRVFGEERYLHIWRTIAHKPAELQWPNPPSADRGSAQ